MTDPIQTNQERNILSQVIDAKLEASNFERAAQWLKLAGKVPGGEAMSVQYGVMLEEICELLDTSTLVSPGGGLGPALNEASRIIKQIGEALKMGEGHVYFFNRDDALDAMSDASMTINGVAYLGGFDKAGYDKAMYDSLFDKFNEDGSPVIKEGGKIGKRLGWSAPNTTPFVGTMPETPEELKPFSFDSPSPAAWVKEATRRQAYGEHMLGWFTGAMEAAATHATAAKQSEIDEAVKKALAEHGIVADETHVGDAVAVKAQ